jgi:quinol monooxygenase YgiN
VQLIATFRVRPGHRDVVRALLADYAELVRADDGTLLFEPGTVADHPEQFVVFERYRDEAAFRAHIGAPENAVFNAALIEHLEGDVRLQFLEPLREGTSSAL